MGESRERKRRELENQLKEARERRIALEHRLIEAVKHLEVGFMEEDAEMKAQGFTHRVSFWGQYPKGHDIHRALYFNMDPRTLKPEDGKVWETWIEIKTVSMGDFTVKLL